MTTELKTPAELWVEALRSGNFKQGQRKLYDGELCCCLGVACLLYQEHVGGLEVTRVVHEPAVAFDGQRAYLPVNVQNWLGLASDCGRYAAIRHGVEQDCVLAHDNDNFTPFDEIADIIESRPKGLFVD